MISDRPAGEVESDSGQSELERLRRENAELRRQLGLAVAEAPVRLLTGSTELSLEDRSQLSLDKASAEQDKIALFRSLFRGREDVYAVRWDNQRTGRKGYAPAYEDPWSLRKGRPRAYLPLTDQAVRDHLAGEKTIGIFPLLKDSSRWFLACDFDKDGWQLDALAFLEVCGRSSVPAYL